MGLPDLLANKLHLNNKALFLPQQYYPLLATEMVTALERVCQALRGEGGSISLFKTDLPVNNKKKNLTCLTDGTNCSLTFVAQILGKSCVQGHSGELWSIYFCNVDDLLMNCMEQYTDDGLLVVNRSIHVD